MPKTKRPFFLLLLANVALSSAIFVAIFRDGIAVSPDGWAYWQGAYTLLMDGQYRYFSGAPIVYWPPAYSAYLALLMALFGSSGLTLLIANGVAVAFQVIGWGVLYIHVFSVRIQEGRLIQTVLLMLFLATLIPLSQGSLLAHNLMLAIFPFLYLSASKAFFERERRRWFLWFGMYILLSALLVATHNTAVLIIAALTLVAIFQRGLSATERGVNAIAIALPSVVAWLIVSSIFQSSGAHTLGMGRYSPFEYLQQALVGVGKLSGLLKMALPLGIAIVVGSIVAAIAGGFTRQQTRLILVAYVFFVLQWVVFCLVWIGDPLEGRFLMIFLLSIAPFFFFVRLNGVAGLIFVVAVGLTASSVYRVGKSIMVLERATGEGSPVVELGTHISRHPEPGQRLVVNGITLIGPPRYPWELSK